MLTRIRVEGNGKTENEVKDQLLQAVEALITNLPIEQGRSMAPWHQEKPISVIPSGDDAFWGYLIVKREEKTHGT